MQPPRDQQYVCEPSAHFRSTFIIRFDRLVLRPLVLQLLSLPQLEQGWQVECVCTWYCREVMVDRRWVTCLVVARLAWARFSMCVWLVRVTLRNYLINWACLVKWAWSSDDSKVNSCCKSRWAALKSLNFFVRVWSLAGHLRQSRHDSFIFPNWSARLYAIRTICAYIYGMLPLVAYDWPSSIRE